MTFAQYFSGLFKGIGSLLTGMSVTIREFFKKKITQQYPENRDTLVIPPRVRGNLTMPHDDNNEHACTACGICQMNCPNGTIQVISEMQEIDGKKKRVLVDYFYDLGQCTFCNLCVLTCPSDAIKFSNEFENAVFNHAKLKEKLNNIGSKLREKKVAPKPAPAVTNGAEKPAPKPAVAATEEKAASAKPLASTPITEEKPASEPKLPPADPDKPVPDVEAPVEKTEEESLTIQENKKTVEQIAIDDVKEEDRREKMAEESLEEEKKETSIPEKKQEPKEDKE